MQIDERTYNRWLKLAKVICSDNQMAEDLLHDLMVNLIEKWRCHEIAIETDALLGLHTERKLPEITDNYIFISLRNRFLGHLHKSKKTREEYVETSEEAEDPQSHVETEMEIQSKLFSIESVVLSLRTYEQKLYTLHFIHGISQRQIAKETGIGLNAINKRILKIKQKIKNYHNGKKD